LSENKKFSTIFVDIYLMIHDDFLYLHAAFDLRMLKAS